MAGRLSVLLRNKEQLMLDVSHELRSPITRLKVLLELIQDEETRKNLQAEVMEMETMVSSILEEARLRNSSASLELDPTDINQLVHSVVEDFKDISPGVVYNACESTTILVDRGKMRMVLRNLIDNAVKHSPEKGQPIDVSLNRDKNTMAIIVKDQGAGIAESALPHIFDPFFRTDASRSRKTGGYGLGLSLCKTVVDAHKGQIRISSKIGQGTKVVVRLPIPEEHHQ
jgi:signal transduction histidine kinase